MNAWVGSVGRLRATPLSAGSAPLHPQMEHKVTAAVNNGSSVTLTVEPSAGGPATTVEADVVLVAIGRRPHTENLGLKELGVAMDKAGRVVIDQHTYKTNVPGLYAIGDITVGPMLAHKAEDEGVALAEILAGRSAHVNYDTVPSIIYTDPEVAWVGKTEEQARARRRGVPAPQQLAGGRRRLDFFTRSER